MTELKDYSNGTIELEASEVSVHFYAEDHYSVTYECPICNGNGTVEAYGENDFEAEIECPHCEGSGKCDDEIYIEIDHDEDVEADGIEIGGYGEGGLYYYNGHVRQRFDDNTLMDAIEALEAVEKAEKVKSLTAEEQAEIERVQALQQAMEKLQNEQREAMQALQHELIQAQIREQELLAEPEPEQPTAEQIEAEGLTPNQAIMRAMPVSPQSTYRQGDRVMTASGMGTVLENDGGNHIPINVLHDDMYTSSRWYDASDLRHKPF